MKFWCASSRHVSHLANYSDVGVKSNDSFSSSASYATISSIPIQKSDSGFSETSSILQTSSSYFEQILLIEKTHHEHLKEYIIKYSRPLRRYLNPTEIVELFQNIEKISTISKSIVRQCEKLLDEQHRISKIPLAMIYQASFGLMIDSYHTYISRSLKAFQASKQCCDKISYFLQISADTVHHEMTEFILLPLRHICVLNELFQNDESMNMTEAIHFLSQQAKCILQLTYNDQISISDLSLQSQISPIIVFQRTDKDSWKANRLDLSESRVTFTELDQPSISTNICLSNVVHIEEDASNEELCLLVASNTRKSSRYSSVRLKRVYVRFEDKHDYSDWSHYLTNAIQDAKDQSWSKTNELVI